MSEPLDGVLGFCTHHRYTFPMIAKLGQACSEAARAAGISVVWHRVPITTVTLALVAAIWIYDSLSVSSRADSSTLRPGVAVEDVPPIAFKPLPGSHASNTRTKAGRAPDAKALSAFRRVRVGKNEVDYIAEDVVIRLFTPNPAPTRVPHLNKEVHFGQDVTVRYFEYGPARVPQTRPDSAAEHSVERLLLVSK
jgi:hypothetical protein